MKKVNIIAFIAFIAGLGVLTSCDPTTEDPIGPEITFQNYDGSDLTLDAGEAIDFSFTINAGDEKLTDVVITFGAGSYVQTIYSAADSSDIKVEDGLLIPVNFIPAEIGSFKLTITVTDKGGLTAVKEINVAVASDLENKEVILGAGGNSNGSYISTSGEVLNITAAKAAPSTVLFAYNEVSGEATILSGTEVTSTEINSAASETTFEKLSGVTFDSASSDDVPDNMTATTIVIATGDIIAFNNAGAKGVFKVGAIQAGTDGQASLSIGIKMVQ